MRKQLFLRYLVLALVALFSVPTFATPYGGTPFRPVQLSQDDCNALNLPSSYVGYYGISTGEELYGFADILNSDNSYANCVLLADIVINENVLNADQSLKGQPAYNWNIIRDLYGIIDGNYHTISGLYYETSDWDGAGFVANNYGTIKNLGIKDSYFSSNMYVGAIASYNDENGVIGNCFNTGTVEETGNGRTGGVVGYNRGIIKICYNTGFVGGYSGECGGVCGSNDCGTMQNCYNLGTISKRSANTTPRFLGGVAGSDWGSISYCYNMGKVSDQAECYGSYVAVYNGEFTKGFTNSEPIFSSGGSDDVLLKTDVEFSDGTVCALLNEGQKETIWVQDKSGHPVFSSAYNKFASEEEDPTATYYTLTTSASPAGRGYVAQPSSRVKEGAKTFLRAIPATGFGFKHWLEDGKVVSTEATLVYTMPSHDVQLQAVFRYCPAAPDDPQTQTLGYWLTCSVSPKSAGSTNFTKYRFPAGVSVWMNTYPDKGWKFKNWTVGDSIVSTERNMFFTVPGKNVNLVANYVFDPDAPDDPAQAVPSHTLTLGVTPASAGYFNHNKVTRVEENSDIRIWAYPQDGYVFKGWQKDGNTISRDNPLIYTMGTSNEELTAVFEFNPDAPEDPSVNYWNYDTGEAIIDYFTTGDLWNALYSKTDGSMDNVKSLTVAGEMNGNDYYIMQTCSGLTVADFSRAYGATTLDNSAAYGNTSLSKVVLPACIDQILDYAFSGCTSLEEVDCYATTPPSVDNGETVFKNIDLTNLTIKVPESALLLYRQHDFWKNYTVMPMDADVRSIMVYLPESTAGQYKNMTIVLTNEASGQQYRYVVSDRVAYRFGNLPKKTTYTATLVNQQNTVLSEIKNIAVAEEEGKTVEVTFSEIRSVLNPSVKVMADSKDVTASTTITWFDSKDQYLKQGAALEGIVQGETLNYQVGLSENLAKVYSIPAKQTFVLEDATKAAQTYTLTRVDSLKMQGTVLDADKKPIANAVVTVSQKINGLYPSTSVARTDKEGAYSVMVKYGKLASGEMWGEATVAVSASDYVGQTVNVATDKLSEKQEFILKSIVGATVRLKLKYQKSAERGQASQPVDGYADYANIDYTLYDITHGKAVTEFAVQYPSIVLLESVADDTEIKLTATSKNDAFNPVETTAKITTVGGKQVADATLTIVQRGAVKATYVTTENASVVGVLYDAAGEFVSKKEYADKALNFDELADGRYSLLSMASSDIFNDFMKLSSLDNAGLENGKDYVLNSVEVKSGVISTVVNQEVPFFDETKVYYTSTNTSFTASKSEITAGNYLTLKATVDFKGDKVQEVNDVKLIVDLPSSCPFVDNSLMIGNDVSKEGYTIAGDRITIPLSDWTQLIRFCINPTESGEYAPNAFVQFMYDGTLVMQPIGNAPFTVKNLSIEVPEKTGSVSVPVSGTAKKGASIYVYDNDVLLAQTTALANGSWSATIVLQNPENNSVHPVYAKAVLTDGTELTTETKNVVYDEKFVVIRNVHMYHNNPEMGRTYDILFDFQNPSNKPGNYIYYIYNRRFTFTVDLLGVPCEDLVLNVFTAKGKRIALKVEYDPKKAVYYASGDFGNYYDGDLPVNVAITECSLGTIQSGNKNCGFGIDPSGYVYEAAHSNRVEGATATIYYREKVYDTKESGVQEWTGEYKEQLWDAAEYEQENPLFTDADGMYRWDVPVGEWQVRLEKDGYQNTQSEWLPVPPPQLDINLPMVNTSAPVVKSATAYEDAVEVEFDRYMDPSTLYAITLTKESDGLSLVREMTYPDLEDGYCRKVRVVTNQPLLATDRVSLTVSKLVQSYAGVEMDQDYSQELSVIKEIKKVDAGEYVNVIYDPYSEADQSKKITVSASPYDAAIGKTVKVASSSDMVVTVKGDDEAVFDENGQAEFTIEGQMSGYATLNFTVKDENIQGSTVVNVSRDARKVDDPLATKASGSSVYHNSNIVLTSATQGASIYYTLDGSEPTPENGVRYTEPILMDEAKSIKAVAKADSYDDSNVKTYEYTIKTTEAGVSMSEGWNWIAHNLEEPITYDELAANPAIQRVLSFDEELVNDSEWGLVGNLSMLSNDKGYKVMTNAATVLAANGYEVNPLLTPVSVESGWNWIGYPLSQETSLAEAFTYATPSEDDVITNIEGGYAIFNGASWVGELQSMKPGQGYMYYANQPFSFKYNSNIVSTANARYAVKAPNNTPWQCNVHKYPNVMCVVADLYVDGLVADADDYFVAAFVDNECRGIGKYVNGRLMISVHGNGGEKVTFRACKNDKEILDKTEDAICEMSVAESVSFSGKIAGSLSDPFILTMGQATGLNGINAADDSNCVYDLSGRRINSKSETKGVYITNGQKKVVH